uniref:FLYWCH-type domain-containing protein n=1 Tax=Caenorhabditis japonica TaxID=281687 RepID=A0A8R1DX20_CAEJA
MSVVQQSTPQTIENLDWAKAFVSKLNNAQLDILTKMYHEHQAAKLQAAEKAKQEELAREQLEKAQREKKESEKQQVQQQAAILELLTSQKPITIDVVRSSTSPEALSQASSSCSEEITVKDVLLGKMKTIYKTSSPANSMKPYRPRGPRERVFFDEHLYIFDKFSYDGKKKFYRCERKNSCPARLHTPCDTDRVIHKVQSHNHAVPFPAELLMYDIDFGKIRNGYLLHVSPSSRVPQSFLTPRTSESGEETEIFSRLLGEKKPVCMQLPDNFNKCTEDEIKEIEMAICQFLMRETALRNEFLNDKKKLPTFFPEAEAGELILFASIMGNNEEDVFQMIKVPARNELSIRTAIQEHFKLPPSRSLMMNISAKINVPLNQQMIDQWKTEEFVRIDVSRPNSWKLFLVKEVE